MKKTLFILSVLLIPLILTFFSGCVSPELSKAINDHRECLAKYPALAEWEHMKTTYTPEGTQVRWRIYVWVVFPNGFRGKLEGKMGYDVVCKILLWTPGEPSFADAVANDWVIVQGRFLEVDQAGRVIITIEKLTNLGPGE
jgi:hypothetical protein